MSKTVDEYLNTVDYSILEKDYVPSEFAIRYVNFIKLVNLIYEQTLFPTYILNADIHQRAINHLADLMVNAKSEKVQSDSANALLTHLKRPETQKVELDIGVKENSAIAELNHTMKVLAARQVELVNSGAYSIKEVSAIKLHPVIEGELDE